MKMKMLALLWMMLGVFAQAQSTDPAYQKELERLYKGTVKLIHPQHLQQKLDAPKKPVVLDTRSMAEYKVSHLPGAIFVDYDKFQENAIAHIDRKTPIVVYCSVGYRSERIGERLLKMGFKEVYNLYGGIFEWANQGHGVVGTDGKATRRVHTYNADWGKWLRVGEKVVD